MIAIEGSGMIHFFYSEIKKSFISREIFCKNTDETDMLHLCSYPIDAVYILSTNLPRCFYQFIFHKRPLQSCFPAKFQKNPALYLL